MLAERCARSTSRANVARKTDKADGPGKPGLFRILPPRDPRSWLDAIRDELAKGKRRDAAVTARMLVEKHPEDCKLALELVGLLADALIELGDSQGGRGRPSAPEKVLPWQHDENERKFARAHAHRAKLHLASNELDWLQIAKDVVGGRRVAANDLAGFFWVCAGVIEGCEGGTIEEMRQKMTSLIERDADEALKTAVPLARRKLQRYGLANVRRQGFKTRAREVVARAYGLTVDQLKRAK